MDLFINLVANGAIIFVILYGIYKVPWVIGKSAKMVVNAFKG